MKKSIRKNQRYYTFNFKNIEKYKLNNSQLKIYLMNLLLMTLILLSCYDQCAFEIHLLVIMIIILGV